MLTLLSVLFLLLVEFLGIETHITFMIIWIFCALYCIIADLLIIAILAHVVEEHLDEKKIRMKGRLRGV